MRESGHIFPLAAVAMARFLDPASAALRHWGGGFLLLSVANAAASFVLVPPWEPFDRVGPVVSTSGAVVAMCEVLNIGWFAGMVLGPLLLGRRARALRATPDDHAARLATAAVASLVPVCLVVLCTVLGVASAAGGLGEDLGIALLLVAMCLAWPMTACGFALAARPAQGPYPVGWALLGRSASLLLGLLSGMVAAARHPADSVHRRPDPDQSACLPRDIPCALSPRHGRRRRRRAWRSSALPPRGSCACWAQRSGSCR